MGTIIAHTDWQSFSESSERLASHIKGFVLKAFLAGSTDIDLTIAQSLGNLEKKGLPSLQTEVDFPQRAKIQAGRRPN